MKFTKIITILALAFASIAAFAAEGVVQVSSGAVTVVNGDEETVVHAGETIPVGSVVKTADKDVSIVLSNGTVISVAPNSTVTITSFSHSGDVPVNGTASASEAKGSTSSVVIHVTSGSVGVQANLNEGSSVVIKTVAGSASVTQGAVRVVATGSTATVEAVSGTVTATTSTGETAVVTSGEKATVSTTSEAVTVAPMTPAEKAEATQQVNAGTTPAPAPDAPTAPVTPSDVPGDNPTHIDPNSPASL